uniref:Uncharacterized protein n=1 Tax=Pyramimonas orientalis virus TaxID=455367 RepID=A0A7M3UP94_POV01|nr:hypothetical protein HWQ62_00436 [Pyramimonas orientalis virus]
MYFISFLIQKLNSLQKHKMPSFTFNEVINYIDRMREESYYISSDYYNTLCEQRICDEAPNSNLSYKWYDYPVVPYMQSMSSTQILENKDLFYFVFNVFMSQNKPPYQQMLDNEHIYNVAHIQYSLL